MTGDQTGARDRIYFRACSAGEVTEATWEPPNDLSTDALRALLEPLTGRAAASALAEALDDCSRTLPSAAED
jgi:hypothetical protein